MKAKGWAAPVDRGAEQCGRFSRFPGCGFSLSKGAATVTGSASAPIRPAPPDWSLKKQAIQRPVLSRTFTLPTAATFQGVALVAGELDQVGNHRGEPHPSAGAARCSSGREPMKIDPGKGWPHPVLRPPEYGDDYPNAEFQVEIECRRAEGGYAVKMTAEFELSDPDLIRLVRERAAEYVLVVKSPRTHFRREFRATDPIVEHSFHGKISGRVEFSSFLVVRSAAACFHCARLALGFRRANL